MNSDGNNIVWVGALGASSPVVHLSLDAGSNWAFSASGCTGWYVSSVIIDSSNAILTTCDYPIPTTVAYVRRRSAAGSWSQVKSDNNKIGRLLDQAGDKAFLISNSEIIRSNDFGTSWAVPGTYPELSAENLQANVKAVLSIPNSSTLYAVGNEHDGIYASGVIYKSTDGGASWGSDYSYSSVTNVSFSSVAVSATTGTLITGGQTGNFWTLHRSAASPWGVVDGPNLGGTAQLSKVLSSSTGDFFAIGNYLSGGSSRWLVRQSLDDGQNWSSKDDYRYEASKASAAFGGLALGGNLYVVGYGIDAGDKYRWLVRRYDGGAWSNFDDDTISVSTTYAVAKAALISANGYLYVAGEYQEASITKWLVKRKNLNAMASWEVVDNFDFMGTKTGATSLTQDSDGRIFVAGYARDNQGKSYSLIRMSRDGVNWVTVDRHAEFGGSQISDIVPCLSSYICTAGQDLSTTNLLRGIIKILRDP